MEQASVRRAEITEKIRAILVQHFAAPDTVIREGATIRGDLQLESLQIVELIARVHKAFGYRSAMEDYREVETFGELVSFVEARLSSGEAAV